MTRDPPAPESRRPESSAPPSGGPPRRALISVSDRTGLADFARGLSKLGWELIASRGTARALADAGLAVTDAADHTGSPPMLGHRVVTLHPRLHGGILADRDDPAHRADLDAHGIDPIDLVVVNLYPFADRPGTETIDVGGPALVRAAAKNCAHVGVVTDPSDYAEVLAELETAGDLSEDTRRRLARRAFALTAAYDAAITAWLDQPASSPAPDVSASVPSAAAPGPATSSSAPGVSAAMPASVPTASGPASSEPGADDDSLPPALHLTLERASELRYGENPHQRAARYRRAGRGGFWDGVVQHGGLPLSYLNLLDAAAAWRLVCDLGPDPAAVIVKHANPCGAAAAGNLADAYDRAYRCDPRSAFGGIVAANRVIDSAVAEAMAAAAQADVVIAPGYAPEAVERLTARRQNTRLLQAPADPAQLPLTSPSSAQHDMTRHDPAQTPRPRPPKPPSTRPNPRLARAAPSVWSSGPWAPTAPMCWCRTPPDLTPTRPTGRWSPPANLPNPKWPTPPSPGGSAPTPPPTPWSWPATAPPGGSGPGSRTGWRPGCWPRPGPGAGPPGGPAPATASTPSPTASKPRPTPGPPSWSSPAGR